jgi:hypothetical protein
LLVIAEIDAVAVYLQDFLERVLGYGNASERSFRDELDGVAIGTKEMDLVAHPRGILDRYALSLRLEHNCLQGSGRRREKFWGECSGAYELSR